MPGLAYIGRFAPSPTGPLHAGSLVAALASWLDARAHGGLWLVRIEDVDTPRCVPGAAEQILRQLSACGLWPDGQVRWQSACTHRYAERLQTLEQAGLAYPCGCTRQSVRLAQSASPGRHQQAIYPGTCRSGLHGKTPRAWRLNLAATLAHLGWQAPLHWQDRRLGPQVQDVEAAVGDFVIRRADQLWAYQLAVVSDDGDQGITDVVRGEDLADNTARQILLQAALGLPTPSYLHTPLVRDAQGEKLSKQQGAPAIATDTPAQALQALQAAARVLQLPPVADSAQVAIAQALAFWVSAWADTYNAGHERIVPSP